MLTRAFDRVLSAKWQHVTAVAAPIGRHVCVSAKPMRDSMVDFLLVALLCIVSTSRMFEYVTALTPSALDLLIHFVTTFG